MLLAIMHTAASRAGNPGFSGCLAAPIPTDTMLHLYICQILGLNVFFFLLHFFFFSPFSLITIDLPYHDIPLKISC